MLLLDALFDQVLHDAYINFMIGIGQARRNEAASQPASHPYLLQTPSVLLCTVLLLLLNIG